MEIKKRERKNKLNVFTQLEGYDHYLGLDWSQEGYSLARLTTKSKKPKYYQGSGKVEGLQEQLSKLRGKKILTIEETTTTHWLYVELKDYVDKIVVCDPYRNTLMIDGAKNDDIDAGKLCILLRGGYLKEVYHSLEESYNIRKLISAYEDLIKSGVRVKNQKSAFYRGLGLNNKKGEEIPTEGIIKFIETQQNLSISIYEQEREKYVNEFKRLRKKIPIINQMCKISGIDTISSVIIYAIVIEGGRFANKNKYWGYCGLANHQKLSGNRNYGKRKTRYSRKLKSVYKTAALAAIRGRNDIQEYYEGLLSKGITEHKARHSVARYIAKATYAMMKNKTPYKPYMWRKQMAA